MHRGQKNRGVGPGHRPLAQMIKVLCKKMWRVSVESNVFSSAVSKLGSSV